MKKIELMIMILFPLVIEVFFVYLASSNMNEVLTTLASSKGIAAYILIFALVSKTMIDFHEACSDLDESNNEE